MNQKPPIPIPASLPLPWEATRVGDNAYWLYAYNKRDSFLAVTSTRDDTPQTLHARAKLFAAAPTMLQALENVFEWLMEVAEPDELENYYDAVEVIRLAMNAAKDYCESGECRGDGFPAFGDVLCSECRALHPAWEREKEEALQKESELKSVDIKALWEALNRED